VRHTDEVTQELFEEFTDWTNELAGPEATALIGHAETFLDWCADVPSCHCW
jgi:hypothetical protein